MLRRFAAAALLGLTVVAGFSVMTAGHVTTASDECGPGGFPPSLCEGPKGPWEWD